MRLDRNEDGDGHGKYALLKLRRLNDFREQGAFGELSPNISDALKVLEDVGALDWGNKGTESEFFVIRLKDRFAGYALRAYAAAAEQHGYTEYASDVLELSERAGPRSPWCKLPD